MTSWTGSSPHITRTGVLIVGAGEAAVMLAQELRTNGYEKSILMIGREPHQPYHRPPLSKDYLTYSLAEEDVLLRDPEFYDAQSIEVLTSTEVLDVQTREGQGGTAQTSRGVIEFDHVVLATGASARTLPIPGTHLAGVHSLRSLNDARALRADLVEASKVAVIGSGFIGMEAAAVINSVGLPVTVIGVDDRVLKRMSAPPISDFLVAAHEKVGIEFVLEAKVTGLIGSGGRVSGVQLDDGRQFPADLVIAGIGAIPEIELARSIGLVCQRGIVVDEYCRTSEPSVLAIGDCAMGMHPHDSDALHPVESVQNAVNRGRVAARLITGQDLLQTAVPWFWSNQGAFKIQIAGISNGYDQYVVRNEDDTGLTVLYFRNERLIAADCVNRPSDFMAVKRALGKGLTIPLEAAHVTAPLKELLVSAA